MRLATLLAALALPLAAFGQSYPSKPIKLLVGFAPGGAADTVARAYAEPLSRALGQPIVIENRAGAGSSIAAETVAHAPADGYTILIASPASISVNPALNPNLNYKPSDLAPVTKVSSSPLVIVTNPATGIGSIRELIAAAKKDPGKLNYATSGVGSAPHFGAAHFSQVAGVQMVHVPFKGGSPAITSVVAGDTQLSFATPPSVLAMVKANRLKALAVTSRERSPLMPDIPGMTEAGLPDFQIMNWQGLFAPFGTPKPVIDKIAQVVAEVVRKPEIRERFAKVGFDARGDGPAAAAEQVRTNVARWSDVILRAGIKPGDVQ